MASEVELERMLVRLVGDSKDFQEMMQDAIKETRDATQQMEQHTSNIEKMTKSIGGFGQMVKNYGTMFLGIAGIGSTFQALKSSISLAAEAEENEVAFGTMLKSAEAGKKMVKDLQDFAAATPLDTNTLQRASKLLLQFGVDGKNVLPIMRMLGDASGGKAENLMSMSLAFGQMSSTGRLMGQDLMQMVNAGFNPLEEMARTSGKSMEYWKGQMEQGRISMKMVAEAFQSATGDGGRFQGLMEKQSKTLSGLFSTMKDDIDGSLREIGKDLTENLNLKGFIQEVSLVAQKFTKWFKSISPAAKAAAAAVVGVAVAFGVLTIGIAIAGKVLNIAFGGIPLITGLIITAIASLIGWVSYLVVQNKGLANSWTWVKEKAIQAWDWIKRKAIEVWNYFQPAWEKLKEWAIDAWNVITEQAIIAWEWIERTGTQFFEWLVRSFQSFIAWVTPIWKSYTQMLITYWGYLKKYAIIVWDFIVDAVVIAWEKIVNAVSKSIDYVLSIIQSLADDTSLTWTDIQDAIMIAFIAAEFAMNNFSAIMSYVWASAAYGVEKFKNTLLYLFTSVIPALIIWIGTNWKNVFLDIFNFATNIFTKMASNIGKLAKNMAKLLTGQMKFSDLWEGLDTSLTKGFESRISKFELPKREISDMERILKEEFDRQGKALGMTWQEFKEKRMAEFKASGGVVEGEEVVPQESVEDIVKKGEETGLDLGASIVKGTKSEISKFDAVLAGSAEALGRITDFQEKMEAARNPQATNTSSNQGPMSSNFAASAVNGADAMAKKDPNTNILKDIRDAVRDNKSSTNIQPANLEDS